jgi:hypothetical protein
VSAVVALLGTGTAIAVARRSLAPPRGAALVAAVSILDLARAGAGINPQTSPAFYRMLPELASELEGIGDGRVFSLGTEASPAFRAWLRARPPAALLWGSFTRRQLLASQASVLDGIPSAFTDDEGAFLLRPPDVRPWHRDPRRVGEVVGVLRREGVTRVLSLDPLSAEGLRPRTAIPVGPPGLAIHVYEVVDAPPRAFVACDTGAALDDDAHTGCRRGAVTRVSASTDVEVYDVEADGAAILVMRGNHARGWTASVGDQRTPVLRAGERHRAVAVPEGRHRVRLEYRPPGLRAGLALMAAGAVAWLGLWVRGSRRSG